MNTRVAAMSLVVALTVISGNPASVPAQCTVSQEALVLPDSQVPASGFGDCVAVDGDTAIVGVRRAGDAAESGGAAYVYRRLNGAWQRIQVLSAGDATSVDQFGTSVDIRGDTIVVGAPTPIGVGRAHIFREIGGVWREVATLTPSDGVTGDLFGYSVALGTHVAFVGALRKDGIDVNNGAVYVFDEVEGQWQAGVRLIDPEPHYEHFFGNAVAVDGDTALVGCRYDPTAHTTPVGEVLVFEKSGGAWSFSQKLQRSFGGRTSDGFGNAIAIDGDTIVAASVSERVDGCTGPPCIVGAAYIFRKSGATWNEQARLLMPDPYFAGFPSGERFGVSVALNGDTIAVGADAAIEYPSRTGAAFLFRELNGEWVNIQRLAIPESQTDRQFGIAVAISDGALVVGETGGMEPEFPGADGTPYPGAAHIYDLVASIHDCNANGVSDDCDIAGGLSRDCNANDIPDDCEPPLGSIADFVGALLNASNDAFDICVFDGDGDGRVDGRDIESYVIRLIGG
ncbi:MAG TPA: hypothetical protein PK093_20820 [Phycisphaerae bacterium]|nr:hypothetical protein [Phycisphaerae bacterium]